ncbi:MAG: biotin/lipoyl-binding protein [Ruminococcus sp.]|nr:biotin/lipoyl-binding protein [Oscillospiraceae bacterium]MDY4414248.1 biotin/lipoyl-binding protein [Ruminococcus sp.]
MNENKKIINPEKRRDIIKNILIVFLIVLLILTFFSNTIMNHSLPEIATESSISGSLTEKLNASGIVESNQSYEVKAKGNSTIDEIKVKTGQEIKKGDILFTVNSEENTELKEAETLLKSLELEYQKMLLKLPKNYATENQTIKNAQEDLNALIAKRDEAVSNQAENDSKKSEYNQAKSELSGITSELADIQMYITSLNTDDIYSIGSEYTGNIIGIYEEYTKAQSELQKAESELQTFMMSPDVSEEMIQSLQDKVNQCSDYLDQCESAYKSEKSALRNTLNDRLDYLNGESDRLNSIINNYESNLSADDILTVDALNEQITAKQRELESLVIALEDAKKQDNLESQSNDIDIKAKHEEIEAQKLVVDKIKKKDSEKEIKADYSGVVSQINVKIGDTVLPDEAVAVIDISEEGYTMTVSVEAEKTKKIKAGISVDVLNDWSNSINADLVEIKNDTQNKKNRILKFKVSGNVNSGDTLSVSIPCSTGRYDTIIPKSALNEDSNGKFVLIVKSKSSPLGNRYFAERVDVEVLASDEVSCAVQGSLNMGDYVITTSSKPVQSGDQVKMKD